MALISSPSGEEAIIGGGNHGYAFMIPLCKTTRRPLFSKVLSLELLKGTHADIKQIVFDEANFRLLVILANGIKIFNVGMDGKQSASLSRPPSVTRHSHGVLHFARLFEYIPHQVTHTSSWLGHTLYPSAGERRANFCET